MINPWYILRVSPEAQSSQCNGDVCSDPRIHDDLISAGFTPYSPRDYKISINKKTNALQSYSRPLFPGYAFVTGVEAVQGGFLLLERTKGVYGLLRVGGNVQPLPYIDFKAIKNAEALEYQNFKDRLNMANAAPDMKTRNTIAREWESGANVMIGGKGSILQNVVGSITKIRSADLADVFIAAFNRGVTVKIDNLTKVA